jgi:hypothetical protein
VLGAQVAAFGLRAESALADLFRTGVESATCDAEADGVDEGIAFAHFSETLELSSWKMAGDEGLENVERC